jgi:putative endonuclease
MYFVYIIECGDGSFYTGITTDVSRRFTEHKNKTASRYTRARGVVRVVYTEIQSDRSSASKREAEIKKMNRRGKSCLILSGTRLQKAKK